MRADVGVGGALLMGVLMLVPVGSAPGELLLAAGPVQARTFSTVEGGCDGRGAVALLERPGEDVLVMRTALDCSPGVWFDHYTVSTQCRRSADGGLACGYAEYGPFGLVSTSTLALRVDGSFTYDLRTPPMNIALGGGIVRLRAPAPV